MKFYKEKIYLMHSNVYDNDGETIVHKISTPLGPKFIGLNTNRYSKYNKNTSYRMSYPICPFRFELRHSTNNRRQSSKL